MIKKSFFGKCPILDEPNYEIKIDYLKAPEPGRPNRYIKGLIKCKYAEFNDCDIKCPIEEEAPDELN